MVYLKLILFKHIKEEKNKTNKKKFSDEIYVI